MRNIINLVWIIVGCAFLFRTGISAYRIWVARDQLKVSEMKLERLVEENKALQEENERLGQDYFIEREIRKVLGYGYPGEERVIFEGLENNNSSFEIKEVGDERIWRKWVRLYFKI